MASFLAEVYTPKRAGGGPASNARLQNQQSARWFAQLRGEATATQPREPRSKECEMKSFRVYLIATALAAFFALQAPTAATGLADPFGGAWTATDPGDGSTLRLQIGAPSAAGARHVTLLDQFASACNAPATALGSGTASDTTLSATLDVRCGGAPFAADVPFTFVLVGDTLVGDDIVFTRVGGCGA